MMRGVSRVEVVLRFPVDDAALSALHAAAFGAEPSPLPWAARLADHSLAWVGAFDGDDLVGFVHAVSDGGAHAFLLDTVVHPAYQRRGIGRDLVRALIVALRDTRCEWVHVDYEPHLAAFYRDACGFGATEAGLLRLT
jgi:ribosomal protein S18 acetylase RimI-like enzyme